jgi:hypothetical protein
VPATKARTNVEERRLQRRVKLGKGTASAVPLNAQKEAGFSP